MDIDPKIVKDHNLKFSDQLQKIVPHGEKILEGPEDPRLFYHKGDIYILINELNDKKQRHMFVSKIDLKNFKSTFFRGS